jgi:hypothetical protein
MNQDLFKKLRDQIPSQRAIEFFITDNLTKAQTDVGFHLNELKDEVIKFFKISQEAASLKLADFGLTGHGNDGTFLDSMVGFAAYYTQNNKLTKKVGPNTWAHHTSSLPEYITSDKPVKFVPQDTQALNMAKFLRRTNISITDIENELFKRFNHIGMSKINSILVRI